MQVRISLDTEEPDVSPTIQLPASLSRAGSLRSGMAGDRQARNHDRSSATGDVPFDASGNEPSPPSSSGLMARHNLTLAHASQASGIDAAVPSGDFSTESPRSRHRPLDIIVFDQVTERPHVQPTASPTAHHHLHDTVGDVSPEAIIA